ncbi:MAG TPA: PadR family transcriptional regulator [Steroidobacteraceae bacterium]|nr:PadR family transcriptional regulator [Steroidobacteraceae bacterium]
MNTPFNRNQWRRFGGFAAGFGDGLGMIGKAILAGRRLAAGELQLVLLALLAERARHGYELIKALEERSGGFYSPSPGMVYPALSWLEEMGYASVVAEGSRKLYSITDSGRTYLEQNRQAADTMLRQLEYIGRRMGRVREIFGGLDEEDELGERGIGAARRELRQALREKRGASSEEKDQVAKILREATARIRGVG